MSGSGQSLAQRNKKLRQDAKREALEAGGHIQHVLDLANKLEDLSKDMDSLQVQRLRVVIDTKLKLINKYMPDLKSQEIQTEVTFNDGTDTAAINPQAWQLIHQARQLLNEPTIN